MATINSAQVYNLTGLWQDENGTTYRLRQIDNTLYWSMDGRPTYMNVFYGTINGSIASGGWAHVPGGNNSLRNGRLTLRIESNDRIVKTDQVKEELWRKHSLFDKEVAQLPGNHTSWHQLGKMHFSIK